MTTEKKADVRPAGRPRVLIVDDQPALIHSLAGALNGGAAPEDEYEILGATTCERALELAPGADLVLLDVMMPGLGGIEVCRRLHAAERTRAIPVIFVTALETAEEETEGFAAGAVDYIVKPIRPAVVRARVRTHLELKASRDLLARLASEDALTGLANRRRFEEAFEREWKRAARQAECVSLLLADIDHFKSINDRYGHPAGDRCLRRVAEALHSLCRRPGEVVARYGGEEFVALLPNVSSEGAQAIAARALSAVRSIPVADLGLDATLSVSIGVVTASPRNGADAQDTIRAADEALYAAKRSGRRRAVVRDLESGSAIDIVSDTLEGTTA